MPLFPPALLERIAREVGTPTYVYSRTQLQERARRLRDAFRTHPTRICFAVKANGNLAVLRTLFAEGLGADIVSGGEMARALAAGAAPGAIVFSGVGKRRDEIEAALAQEIAAFNVESLDEVEEIDAAAARLRKRARIALRINPNIDVKTNPHIATGLYTTKFGIAESDLAECLSRVSQTKHCDLIGLACHLGSQITELESFQKGARRMAELSRQVAGAGHRLQTIDLGGGLGVRYTDESPPGFGAYARVILDEVRATGLQLVLEPGRCLVAEAGVLLTRVIRLKSTPQRRFVVVDAAMNDLIRPCLYDAHHPIEPVLAPTRARTMTADVVGPVCESADFLGRQCALPELAKDELLAIGNAGAYGATMASEYNTRARAPEVLVNGDAYTVVRRRETITEILDREVSA